MKINEQHLCREMSFATLQIDIHPAGEDICRKYNAVVVCTGGFHVDHITESQISEVIIELSLLLQQID